MTDGIMHTACMIGRAAGKTHSNRCKGQIMADLCRLRQAVHMATSSFLLPCLHPCHLSCLFQLQLAHQSAEKQKERCLLCSHDCQSTHCKRDGLAACENCAAMDMQHMQGVLQVIPFASNRYRRQVSRMLALLTATAECAGLLRVLPVATLRGRVSLLSSLAELPANLCLSALLCTTTAVPLPCSIW